MYGGAMPAARSARRSSAAMRRPSRGGGHRLTESRFAQRGNQIPTNASTSNHDTTTLAIATFSLMAMMSSSVKGSTATNGGTDKSSDQNVGLANAIPTGTASTIGVANVPTGSGKVWAASSRTSQESGPRMTTSTPPTRIGSASPEHRHSNQK